MLALDVFLIIILFSYIASFLIAGAIRGRAYLKSSPTDTNISENLAKEIADYQRSETISHTLAGFALTALTFIISLTPNLVNFEILIVFFSLSLIFEITSSLFYRRGEPRLYKYLGFVFQYAGLLAVINGFFSFLTEKLPNAESIWIVYISALILFFWLTVAELKLYLSNWKGWEIRSQSKKKNEEEKEEDEE